jgi:hypothetical protein
MPFYVAAQSASLANALHKGNLNTSELGSVNAMYLQFMGPSYLKIYLRGEGNPRLTSIKSLPLSVGFNSLSCCLG